MRLGVAQQEAPTVELKCYVYDRWDLRIRPASPRRSWMEDTPERFAYRCLPLAIANGHGWEILSPCGFEARWDGTQRVEGVEVRPDPDSDPRLIPVALFGQGTVTFHVQGIFRTPPGWNLWVGGSPNGAKDGIAPLSAVVETDWSPYSFTMNWRFTRPHQWVRFEENEPFCFVFPVQRQALTAVEPTIVPIDENPQLKAEFEAWSASREAFQAWVAEAQPAAPADRWQKLYYRGVRPNGLAGATDHQSKLHLRKFRRPDGSFVEPAEPRCPVRHEMPGTEVVPAAAGSETGVPLPAHADEPAARRREWVRTALEAQQRLGCWETIEREASISGEEFLERYYAPGRPVVLTGQLADWPALELWTPRYLADRIGDAPVEFQGGRSRNADFELYKDNHKETASFRTFMERIAGDVGNETYLTAYNSGTNAEALRPLFEDVRPLDKFLRGEPGMMWIGPLGTFTPLHYDLTNNFIAQVVGSKKLFLLPPSETPLLYNERHVFSEVHDIMDEERLASYPLAADARSYEVDLEAGDILFVPVGWWHQVTALDFSVTLTFTDFLWPNDHYRSFPYETRAGNA